jgi:sulfite exporter TauE/SafE
MSLIPEFPHIANPFLLAFIVGVIYGLTYCTSSCLPYLAGYIAGVGAGFRRGTVITLTFNLGRVVAYTIIGCIVAIISGAFGYFITESSLAPIQQYSVYAFAAVTIAIGVILLLKTRKGQHCEIKEQTPSSLPTSKLRRFDLGAFSLGLSRGLVLCPPLVVLLLDSAVFAAPINSVFVTVLFGVGTTLSPILILGGATGWLLNKAPLLRKWIAIGGAIILIILGILSLVTALTA